MNATAPAYSKPTIALALLCGALPGLFLLITSTTYLVPGEFVYDIKRLLQLCIMTALFLAATLNPGLRNAFGMQLARIPTWVKALLGLIVALGITSSIVNATSNMHLAYSLLEVALLSLLVLAALVIAACRVVAGELFDQVAITLLAMTSIAVGIQELLGVAAALANDTEFYFRISLMYYSWPRFYNQVQAWTLPILAALPYIWSRSKSDLLRNKAFQAIVCLAAIGLNWYIILMTGGRGVALSLAMALTFGAVVSLSARNACLKWHLTGALLGGLLFLAIVQVQQLPTDNRGTVPLANGSIAGQPESANPDDWFEADGQESRFTRQSIAGRLTLDSSGRLYMWQYAYNAMRNNPWLGIGPGQFACKGPLRLAAHPHNFILQIGAEWGVLVGFIVFALFAIFLIRLTKLKEKVSTTVTQHPVASLLATGVFAAQIYSLLSGVLIMPASQVAGILVFGWLVGLAFGVQNAQTERTRKHSTAFTTLTVLLAALVTVSAFGELGNRKHSNIVVPSGDSLFPRFWQDGKLCKYFRTP